MRAIVLTVLVAMSGSTAWAAGPTKQALNAAAEALYLDFGREGVAGTQEQVRGAYQAACDLGYELACRSEKWHDELGLADLNLAAAEFANKCSRTDPVACVVEGWAIEAEPIADNLEQDERIERELARLVDASEQYRTGCATQHWAPCLALAHYSAARAELGADEPDQIAVRERGAKAVYQMYCRRGELRACVFGAALEPQDPSLLTRSGSAAYVYNDACVQGYTPGCYELGLMLAPQKSEQENRHWFDGLCDRGHAQSCLWVGRSFNDPTNADAVEAYRRACALKGAEGCAVAGPALEATSPDEAMQAYKLGCALDDGRACGSLGMLHVKQGQHSAAVDFLDRGCAAGQIDACVQVGLLRKDGVHVVADPGRARADLERGCAAPGPRRAEACFALGNLHEEGLGVVRDRAKATAFYRTSCDEDHIPSCFRMGESVNALQRASQTDELQIMALSGYTRACAAGLKEACLPAAEGYATGPVSVRDDAQARERFKELCEEGDAPKACRRYGHYLLSHGTGDKDLREARDAFARGRDQGDSEATRQLAKLFYMGVGGSRSRPKARRLFNEACRDGNGLSCGGMEQPDLVRP